MLKSEYIQKWCKKNYMKSYYSLNSERFGVKTSKMDLEEDDDYQTYLAYCKFNPRSKNPDLGKLEAVMRLSTEPQHQ